ncbi:hypothetical protein LJC15_02995 [Desulfovibrio sp. OttesenSCG-928-G11]|nr:hypothetical protein [Desulfovibrio sp. OttesenSCG-928-G11]
MTRQRPYLFLAATLVSLLCCLPVQGAPNAPDWLTRAMVIQGGPEDFLRSFRRVFEDTPRKGQELVVYCLFERYFIYCQETPESPAFRLTPPDEALSFALNALFQAGLEKGSLDMRLLFQMLEKLEEQNPEAARLYRQEWAGYVKPLCAEILDNRQFLFNSPKGERDAAEGELKRRLERARQQALDLGM